MKEHLSGSELIIIVITLVLFVVALFVKGLTKDMLLEAGVLLISIKLILMNYKNVKQNNEVLEELKNIKQELQNSK